MAARFIAVVPRLALVGFVWLLATGTMTYAAGRKLTTPEMKPAVVVAPTPTLVVPDIRGQAFVFAKGILEDDGFGWHVTGGAQGYATNVVVSQRPAPGTRVRDTGAPTLALTLRRGTYSEDGTPQNSSPYAGTAIVLARVHKTSAVKAVVKPAAKPAVKRAAKPAAKRVAHPKMVRKHIAKRVHARPKHVAAKPKKAVAAVKARPPAFVVPGAPKEPLDEIPLATRAHRLSEWLTPSRRPTASNQHHWLYQHAWIVMGARFGWWHGAAALELLINVDRRVESQWSIGYQSESVARRALAAVEARAK